MKSRLFRFLILPLLSLGISAPSQAESEKIPELKTTSGKVYQNVRITRTTPSSVSITHDSGATRIPMAELPEDLKKKLGFDPAKAAEHAKTEAKADAEAERQNDALQRQSEQIAKQRAEQAALLKKAKPMQVHVTWIKEKGFRIDWYEWYNQHNSPVPEERVAFVVDYPELQKLSEGDYVKGMFVEDGNIDIGPNPEIKTVVRKLRWVGPFKLNPSK